MNPSDITASRSGRSWWVVVPLLVYVAVCASMYVTWDADKALPVTGDEPHYLVMTRGIAELHALEQTGPYALEQRTHALGLGPRETQAIPGPNGRFNVHSLGLPLLLVPADSLWGPVGDRVFMMAMMGLALLAIWAVAARRMQPSLAALTTVAVCVSLPFLPAATQIYPDLLAGIISLVALIVVCERRGHRPFALDLATAALLAFQPWLQVKFAPAAVIVGAVLVVDVFRRERARAVVLGTLMVGSWAVLIQANRYMYDNWTGPYGNGAAEFSMQSFTVFLGLHLDRFQGMFIMAPLLLFGLFELVRSMVRGRPWAFLVAAVWLALVVPNAMHPNWFGGLSFAGRFGWAGAAVLMYPTVRGIARLVRRLPAVATIVMMASIALQGVLFHRYVQDGFDFYNNQLQVKVDDYRSVYGPVGKSLPAFYNSDWAFDFTPNRWALGLLVGGILLVVAVTVATSWSPSRRSERTSPSPNAVAVRRFLAANTPREPAGVGTGPSAWEPSPVPDSR